MNNSFRVHTLLKKLTQAKQVNQVSKSNTMYDTDMTLNK